MLADEDVTKPNKKRRKQIAKQKSNTEIVGRDFYELVVKLTSYGWCLVQSVIFFLPFILEFCTIIE